MAHLRHFPYSIGVSGRLSRRRVLVCVAAGALAAATQSARAIVSGLAPDSPDQRVDPNSFASPWAGVGALVIGNGVYSGALVGRAHVLTAAHVVAGAGAANVQFVLNVGGDATHRSAGSAIFVHPDYQGVGNGHKAGDVALLRLAVPPPPGVPRFRLWRAPLRAGALLMFVGYGAAADGAGERLAGASATVKRLGANVADRLEEPGGVRGWPCVFRFDFDGPAPAPNAMGGGSLGNGLESTVMGGDSGAPAFVRTPYGWRLAGVLTHQWSHPDGPKAPRFGSGGGGVLVAPYADWLDAVSGGDTAAKE